MLRKPQLGSWDGSNRKDGTEKADEQEKERWIGVKENGT